MVFEKDIHKVKEGQKVQIVIESMPNAVYRSTVHVVGKTFEQDLKAVRIHADIENEAGQLIPGMYVRGRILTENAQRHALPEAAVVREGDKHFIFTAQKEIDNGEAEWLFEPVEVTVGAKDGNWLEIQLLSPLPATTQLAWNNAYYLMAEMKKGEAEHSH
jgi:cobalt-zinc-cadmium efflux system membrane fusion protein